MHLKNTSKEKNKLKKLVALFVVVAAFLSINTNTLFSQPQLKLSITGGYNLPMPQLKGEQTFSTIEADTYGMKQGFNFGADAKYYLGKKRNVGITLGLNYNMFSNNVDSTLAGTSYTRKSKINSFQAALGIEYNFMPKGKTQPFLGLGITGNFINGSVEMDPTLTGFTKSTIESSSRFGVRIGGGLDFALSKQVGAVIGFNYNMANLIGKDSSTVVTPGQTEFNLNDKEYTIGGVTNKAKNINYIQFYAGVSFYFNQPKKTTKK